jgi:hypothetical protein
VKDILVGFLGAVIGQGICRNCERDQRKEGWNEHGSLIPTDSEVVEQ